MVLRTLFILSVVFSTTAVFAQKTIYVSPELGFSAEPLRMPEATGNAFHLGINGGLKGHYQFHSNWSVGIGALVSSRKKTFHYEETYREEERINNWIKTLGPMFGMNEEDTIDITNSFIKINTNNRYSGSHRQLFIDFPVQVSYTYQNFSVYAGGYISLLLRNETVTEMYSETPALDILNTDSFPEFKLITGLLFPNHKKTDITYNTSKNGLQTVDYGLLFGLSYQTGKAVFYTRYMMGMRDYRMENTNDEVYKNHLLQAGIAFRFAVYERGEGAQPRIE